MNAYTENKDKKINLRINVMKTSWYIKDIGL